MHGTGQAESPASGDNEPGLYIHVPFCDGKCSYCAFYSVRHDVGLAGRYVAAVEREFEMSAGPAAISQRAFGTVYFGGGTPTILSCECLERLCGLASARLRAGAEWTVEANPGTITKTGLDVLRRAGVNRVSVGAQSFDDDVLRRLGRRHSAADTAKSIAMIREAGFTNIGIDLIACVPGVDKRKWRATLEAALALEPAHISVYALTVEEGTALNELARTGSHRVPADDAQLAFLHMARDILGRAGYGRYEISNYALPGFECRHNLACWRGAEYIGLGPAASSHTGLRRWTNAADLQGYLGSLENGRTPEREAEELSRAVKATEMVIFGLRMAEGVDLRNVRARSGIGEEDEKKLVEVLQRLSESALIKSRGSVWILTDLGRDVADYAAVEIIGWEDGSAVT